MGWLTTTTGDVDTGEMVTGDAIWKGCVATGDGIWRGCIATGDGIWRGCIATGDTILSKWSGHGGLALASQQPPFTKIICLKCLFLCKTIGAAGGHKHCGKMYELSIKVNQ